MGDENKIKHECNYSYCKFEAKTPFAHQGWFAFLYFISACTFGLGIEANSNFKISLFLLSAPVLFNYISHVPSKDKVSDNRYKYWVFEVILTGFFFALAILALFGITEISSDGFTVYYNFSSKVPYLAGIGFEARKIWVLSLIMVVITVVDCFIDDSNVEKSVRVDVEKSITSES